MLLAVVQEGTATKADLATFEVAGKSGTARRTSQNAGYTAGNYTASFVGLFPGNDPQYVVLVKLDSRKGAHYAGGDIAAPVTQIVLRAALAARDAALDREGLAASEKSTLADAAATGSKDTHSAATPNVARSVRGDATIGGSRSYDPSDNLAPRGEPGSRLHRTSLTCLRRRNWPWRRVLPITPRAIPDVRRLSVREAVRALHGAGFRVRVVTARAPAHCLPPVQWPRRAPWFSSLVHWNERARRGHPEPRSTATGYSSAVNGELPVEAAGISDDSRKVQRGDLFIAVRGWNSDGHDFSMPLPSAVPPLPSSKIRRAHRFRRWSSAKGRRAAAIAAATAYRESGRNLTLLGVTGTNGKTTTTSIMRHLFDDGADPAPRLARSACW